MRWLFADIALAAPFIQKPRGAVSGMQSVNPMTRLVIVVVGFAYIVPKIHPVTGHKYC